MRCSCVILRVLLALAAVAASVNVVHAQSLFERLFGDAAPSGPVLRPEAFTAQPQQDQLGLYPSESDDIYGRPDEESARTLSKAGSYRTLCVRMCDGFYWPVSSSANRGKFYTDAKVCQASCDMEARLFYMPRTSDDVAAMRDLSGRVYGRLPTAFAYRKAIDSGCLCKPEPWSEASALRHEAYAAASAGNGQERAVDFETSSLATRRYAPRVSASARRRGSWPW